MNPSYICGGHFSLIFESPFVFTHLVRHNKNTFATPGCTGLSIGIIKYLYTLEISQ
jgi:hypothetical protein